MLVKELIEKLKNVDENLLVVWRWYEWWYDDIWFCEVDIIEDNSDGNWNNKTRWDGKYHDSYIRDEWYEKIKAIFL